MLLAAGIHGGLGIVGDDPGTPGVIGEIVAALVQDFQTGGTGQITGVALGGAGSLHRIHQLRCVDMGIGTVGAGGGRTNGRIGFFEGAAVDGQGDGIGLALIDGEGANTDAGPAGREVQLAGAAGVDIGFGDHSAALGHDILAFGNQIQMPAFARRQILVGGDIQPCGKTVGHFNVVILLYRNQVGGQYGHIGRGVILAGLGVGFSALVAAGAENLDPAVDIAHLQAGNAHLGVFGAEQVGGGFFIIHPEVDGGVGFADAHNNVLCQGGAVGAVVGFCGTELPDV